MSGRQSKVARSAANREAIRRGLWKQGEKDVYSKWWRKILAKVFPKIRKRYTDAIGRWYKRILKSFAKQAYAAIHDRDLQELRRVQKKIARDFRMRKRMVI